MLGSVEESARFVKKIEKIVFMLRDIEVKNNNLQSQENKEILIKFDFHKIDISKTRRKFQVRIKIL